MSNIYANLNKSMHDTHVKYCISATVKKTIRQVTTTINRNTQHCSIQLQKEVKSNPKTAQL